MRRASILWFLAWLIPAPLAAQNSVYGVVGLGFPGEPIGVRARALGGGIAAFDPASALNPATPVGLGRLAAMVSVGTSFRRYTTGDSTVSGLRETRYPFGLFGGRVIGTPLSFALSYSSYAERSYDVTSTGTQMLRGDSVQITDRLTSDGGISDLRGALAVRVSSALWLGSAVHLIGGSSRIVARRSFSDSAYSSYAERSELQFSGTGLSAGLVFRPLPAIELSGVARMDGKLTTRVGPDTLSVVHLPATFAGGLRLSPAPGVNWSATATWRSWSKAQPDLGTSARAFDSWEFGSGLELSRPRARGSGIPLRLGVRYRELPFSNVGTQAEELVFAGGTGLRLAEDRAAIDLSVENLRRSGGGATERGWQITLGILVVP
jgi:hypothetical protein